MSRRLCKRENKKGLWKVSEAPAPIDKGNTSLSRNGNVQLCSESMDWGRRPRSPDASRLVRALAVELTDDEHRQTELCCQHPMLDHQGNGPG